MSTDQITGNNGMLEYAPEEDNNENCERCGKIIYEIVHLEYTRNGMLKTMVVCQKCYDEYYEFYSDNYFLMKE